MAFTLPTPEFDPTLERGGIALGPFNFTYAQVSGLHFPEMAFGEEAVPNVLEATLPTITAEAYSDDVPVVIEASLPVISASLSDDHLQATLPSITGESTLTEIAYGLMDATLPLITLESTLVAQAYGNLAADLPLIEGSCEAVSTLGVAASLTTLSSAFTVVLGTTGGIETQLPVLDVEVAGGDSSLLAVSPSIEFASSGFIGAVARLEATLQAPSADVAGTPSLFGNVSALLPSIDAGMVAFAGRVASIEAVIRPVTVNLNGVLGNEASLSGALELITGELGGYAQVNATLSAITPSFEFSASAYTPVAQVATYVVDTIGNAVTTFESFQFNSFAEINGKYYGAGPDGLFELVGEKDDSGGADIDIAARLSTGHLHFGSEMQKRVSDFFIAMRADGDITLTVTTDENQSYEYTLSPLDIETLKQRRSLIGKGAKGKYWQFTLENESGCDFDFDGFNAAAVVLNRRL